MGQAYKDTHHAPRNPLLTSNPLTLQQPSKKCYNLKERSLDARIFLARQHFIFRIEGFSEANRFSLFAERRRET
jgi:hypothetical protein